MAYATVSDDIQPRVGIYLTLGVSSTPTSTQVERWIAETSAKLNSALRRAGYGTVPVTGANDLLLVRGVVADKVALQTLIVGLGFNQTQALGLVETFTGFADFLAALKNGDAVLEDQSPSRNDFATIQAQVYEAYYDGSDPVFRYATDID